jgi:DNA-binding beta-propeller fold protein YncE
VNAELDTRARRATSALHLSADALDPVGRLHDLRRAERRRSRAQVVAAFAVLVALVAAGLLARRYDPPAVGPLPSLGTIPVGRQPTGMAVGGGSLWVVNREGGTVSRIDLASSLASSRVVATVPVGNAADAVAVGRDAVWVGGWSRQDGDTVLRIDPMTNRVTGSLRVAQPQGVALGFGSVWVPSERAGEVLRIDPRTDPRTVAGAGRIKVDGAPVLLAVGPDAVWVGTGNQTIQRIDPGTGTVTASFRAGGTLHGMAVDGRSLWTVDPVGDTVSRSRLPGR